MRKTISLFLAVLMMLVLLPAVRLNGSAAADDTKTYELVTSADGLVAGGKYLIVNANAAGSAMALSKQNNNNRSAVAVTVAADKTISLTAAQIATADTDSKPFELTLGGSLTDGWSFYDPLKGGYLYAPGGGNYLRTQTTNDIKGLFTVTVSSTSTTIVSKGDVTQRNMRYNPNTQYNSPLFSCYTDSSGVKDPVYLYKLVEGTAPSGEVIVPATLEIPFCQVDSTLNCKNDTAAAINFTASVLEPMENGDGDQLAWTVNGGGSIAAGNTFQLTVHIAEAAWLAAKPGNYIGTINWSDSATGKTGSVNVTTVVPVTHQATLKETIADGDKVVIYYPAGNKVMSATTSVYGTKTQIDPLDATLNGDTLLFPEGTAIFNIEIADDQVTFKTDDGKYLYLDSSDVKFADAAGDYTLFALEDTTSTTNTGHFIKSVNALYGTGDSAKTQYLEYYAEHFTVRSMNTSSPDIYTFQFFAINDVTPPQPAGDGAVVLFTNDVHCEIDAAPKTFKPDGSVDNVGSWGYAGVAYVKKQLEAEGNSVFLVDAGDHVQGGPIGALSKGEYIIDIMNYVGYDLAAPGNHEFDYGMEQFFKLTSAPTAQYPYVSANFMHYENGEPTTPVFDAFKTFEATDGTIIAFVGVSTPESITKSTPTYFQDENGNYIYGFCQDLTGDGVVNAVQAAIDAAAQVADFVVVVGHLGIDDQSSPWMSTEIISKLHGAIAYIDGHSHSTFVESVKDGAGKDVQVAQTGTKLANIGKMTISSTGEVSIELLPAPAEITEDPETKAYIDQVKEPFNELLAQVVAYTENDLTIYDENGRAVRKAETNLGDLCADAYRAKYDADVAFVNGGGVRANISAGEITFGNIINVHPFSNSAVLAEVSGQQILDALEMGARVCPSENGGFLQVSGLTYEIHTYREANVVIGSDKMWQGTKGIPYRVQNVRVLNRETGEYDPLDLEKTYKLASHNYMLEDKGDGFAMFGKDKINILESGGTLDNQVLINYIQSMPGKDVTLSDNTTRHYDHVVSGYTDPKGEGRIKIVDTVPPTGDTVILFTNDVHCEIDASPKVYKPDGSVDKVGSWGYAGLAKVRKDLIAEGNEVLLVDAGDHVQGGPIGALSKGEYIIDIMNYVGYDVAIPGNHEFDYGMDQFFNLINNKAAYPYVSANFMDLSTNKPVFEPYKIFEANGKKIAFVGLSTPESITKSTPTYFQDENGNYIYGFCQDETGIGVYTAAQTAVDMARNAGADYVIVIGHMGIDEQSSPWMSTEVIANLEDVDAFIDGHSHSEINTAWNDHTGAPVFHAQTGTKFANIGKLTIHADGSITVEMLPAPTEVAEDPETKAYIDQVKEPFNELLAQVVAYTENDLTINDENGRAVRRAETNLGDLCADAYRTKYDADVAFVNGGGVRANISTGEITFGNIINVHPFSNSAVLAEVSGQQILDALEMGARVCPSENGGFLHVSGLTYEININRAANVVVGSDKMWQGPAGTPYRVMNVKVLNKETGEYEPLDLEKTYKLASHNYMLEDMGDGFAMFGKKNITILESGGTLDNQVLIDYIQSMPGKDVTLADGTTKHYDHVISDYANPKGEGRIKIVALQGTIYGEDVNSGDIAEFKDGKIAYRYDIKVKDVPADLDVVSLQAFIQFDSTALKFLEARTELEGSVGINDTVAGKLMFGWAAEGAGVSLADEQVVVSLYFEPVNPIPAGTKLDITFTTDSHGNPSGLGYADGDNVVEAACVETQDGSITFDKIMLGDANCDGKITSADAAVTLRSVVGLSALTPQGMLNADVNGDAKITAEDAAIILRYVVALISAFPAA